MNRNHKKEPHRSFGAESTTTEMKYLLEGLNGRFELREERNHKA